MNLRLKCICLGIALAFSTQTHSPSAAQGLGAGGGSLGRTMSSGDADWVEGVAEEVAPSNAGALRPIYFIPGIQNSDDTDQIGSATSFQCLNKTAATQTLAFRLFDRHGALITNRNIAITAQRTLTASTHNTTMFAEDYFLAHGIRITQGHAVILSTANNIYCSATVVDAAAEIWSGRPLPTIRHNAPPGVQD